MKEQYKDINFREESLKLIKVCNGVISTYQKQGLRLTLRQLYYQLVSKNIIKNEEKSYKRLGSILSDGRLAGLVDWDAIEDRVRQPKVPQEFDDPEDLMEAALRAYRLPRWLRQDNYVELWVEKDALAGVLAPIAHEYHITLMVNRGYSSQSAMYESAQRFLENERKVNKTKFNRKAATFDGVREFHLLYLGDHDPSGEDMVRDVEDRLNMFGVDLTVTKLALTMDQVEEHEPPPNPTKMTDSRAGAYVEKYGDSSWEVDALPPDVLAQIIRDAIEELVDMDLMEEMKEQERQDKKLLTKAVANLMKEERKGTMLDPIDEEEEEEPEEDDE